MAYVALYRKWRPQNFDTLVGQAAVKTALTNALVTGRIAHAYLFSGPRGTGKTSTARILAKALNCEHGPTANPCGVCTNCQRITEGTSMDVFEIDAASNRGIDEIKALREQLAFAPVNGKYKVYIIDEVHMLTTEAFNALLKSLEEPPAHVIFILATTDPHKIPATIHSRCQRYDFRRVTVDEIADHLDMVASASGLEADKDALRLIAIQAEGGMRDALSLLDQCGVMDKHVSAQSVREVLGIVGRETLRKLVSEIGKNDLTSALASVNELLSHGKDPRQIVTELAEYLRAILLYKAAPSYSEVYLTDTEEALKENAPLFGRDRLMAAEERLHTAAWELKNSMRPRITLELCLFDLCREEGSTLVALAARVEKLERKLATAQASQDLGHFSAHDVHTANQQPTSQVASARKQFEQKGFTNTQSESQAEPKDFAKQQTASPVESARIQVETNGFAKTQFVSSAQDIENQSAPEEITNTQSASHAEPARTQPVFSEPAKSQSEVGVELTKPQLAVDQENTKREVEAKQVAQQNIVEEFGGDFAQGEEYWKEAIEYLAGEKKTALVSCVKNGRAFSFVNNVLTLACKSKFFCDRIMKPDYKVMIEDALLKVARIPIKINVVEEGNASKPASKSKREAPKSTQQSVNFNDLPSNLKKAQDLLGGTIEKIDN
ncbi:MAG: DNA polymerase III subunit gamma/tau [Phascolarctobacterium sp.]|nr:DNA polymerase III subunit gamma/tau [Phascolarctobacterium sp.]